VGERRGDLGGNGLVARTKIKKGRIVGTSLQKGRCTLKGFNVEGGKGGWSKARWGLVVRPTKVPFKKIVDLPIRGHGKGCGGE